MTSELPVPPNLWRTAHPSEDAWMTSAVALLDLVAHELGVADLGDVHLLDMGCGTKFTKAIVEQDLPIGRYVGIDTSADVIALLQDHVDDPRFEFHHIDIYNELYNQDGVPLDQMAALPVDGEVFDAICLFSVFTHLAPHDYHEMLRVLRPHIKPDGRLIYSLFINQPLAIDDDSGALEAEIEARLSEPTPADLAAFEAALERRLASADDAGSVPDFVDAHPDQTLMWALYSRRHAYALIEGTGWRPLALHPPNEYVQHYFTCAPELDDRPA